jgi:serine/threonine-protein kinase
VPPLLFAFAIILGILRLKVALPIVLGALAGGAYLVIYFLVIWHAPLAGHIDPALARPAMQVSRAFTLLLFGTLGALANRALRRMIGQAAKKSRAKDLFGKYRLGDLIASGGMGSVYEAVYCPEGGFERKVAVKRVHPHLAADPTFVQRFREEAELGARLAHPNIVTVLDFGREGETYFFAMEFVDGMDLSKVRKRCASANLVIPARIVAFIGHEIAEGLAYAHEVAQGADGKPLHVVHRDLNPANVLISRTGQVKISDFGVAKVLGEASAHETSHVVGKIAYLAPELARGVAFDARVDVFALGLVLWELLCLKQAYARGSDAATLSAVVHSNVAPPSLLRPELSARWDEFCALALQPDPEKRYASARQASVALAAILEEEGLPQPGEISDFVREVEAIPAPSTTSQSVSTLQDPLEAPTVVEQR